MIVIQEYEMGENDAVPDSDDHPSECIHLYAPTLYGPFATDQEAQAKLTEIGAVRNEAVPYLVKDAGGYTCESGTIDLWVLGKRGFDTEQLDILSPDRLQLEIT